MLKKFLIPALCAASTFAGAEPQRAFLTTENKFPEIGALEIGYDYTGREFDTLKYNSHSFVARYGLIENLTARAHVPFDSRKPDFGSDQQGLGDVVVGLDLVAYQDVFSFPFVIPHLDISFPTGDDNKGLGSGDTLLRFGVAVGTKTHEQFNWIIDFSYASVYDAKASEKDDVFEIGFSWIWEISDQFTFNLEALFQHAEDTSSDAVLLGGGMNYKWTPALQTGVFLGEWTNQDSGEDKVLNITAAYTF